MNLTESLRARNLILSVIIGKNLLINEEEINWKSCIIKMATIAFGYGVFFALKRRLCPEKKNVAIDVRPTPSSNNISNAEICPICLEPPQAGVRSSCGHRLCARCLLQYCERRIEKYRNQPPPCPLCRMPLVAVSLAYHQSDRGSNIIDPEIIEWIREYNSRGGLIANHSKPNSFVNDGMIFVKLLVMSLLVRALAKYQGPPGVSLVTYTSFLITALGMTLLLCLWLKCQEDADLEVED